MFFVKDSRVSFKPDESDYCLGMNVPNILKRTRDQRSPPVPPQVPERDRQGRKSQSVHNWGPDFPYEAVEQEKVIRRFRVLLAESTHRQGPTVSSV